MDINPGVVGNGTHRTVTLDEHQMKAVTSEAQFVRVLAGPGSGKTRVLIERVALLLEKGVAPDRVLVVTFTSKAAEELKERLKGMAQGGAVIAGTFHSVCNKMLRCQQGDHRVPGPTACGGGGASQQGRGLIVILMNISCRVGASKAGTAWTDYVYGGELPRLPVPRVWPLSEIWRTGWSTG